AVAQVDFENERFDQHLRKHYVQLRNDVADHGQVTAICKDEQRVGAFVRKNLGRAVLADGSEVAATATRTTDGSRHGLVQPLAKAGARASAERTRAAGGSDSADAGRGSELPRAAVSRSAGIRTAG